MNRPLFRPVKPLIITQPFGANRACVSTDGTKKVITCDGNNPPKGYKSLYGPGGHKGLDLVSNHSQPVYCALDGIVNSIDTDVKSGLDVKVISEIEGRKFRHIYEHLLGYQPKIGDGIEAGDLIGWADNTGYSSGDHLHFQLEEWDAKKKKWIPIDPLPLMSDFYAQDKRKIVEILARISELLADLLRKKNQI